MIRCIANTVQTLIDRYSFSPLIIALYLSLSMISFCRAVEIDKTAIERGFCSNDDALPILNVRLTAAGIPADGVTWEIIPHSPTGAGSVDFFPPDSNENISRIAVLIGNTEGVYELKVTEHGSPTESDSITIVVGPTARIISYIQKFDPLQELGSTLEVVNDKEGIANAALRSPSVLAGLTVLAGSINETRPPDSFDSNRDWQDYIRTMDYRGYLYMQPVAIFDSKGEGEALCSKLLRNDVSHGFTPLLGGFEAAEANDPELRKIPGEEDKAKQTWRHKLRIGQTGQFFQKFFFETGAPFAWQEISFKLESNGNYKLDFSGSNFPAHAVYVNDQKLEERSQTGLGNFLYTGGGTEAEGNSIIRIESKESGGICTYTIESPDGNSHSANKSNGSFELITADGCSWKASTEDQSWLKITTTEGTGTATIQYTVEPNGETTAREGIITVEGQQLTVNQSGTGTSCSYKLDDPKPLLGAETLSGSIRLTTSSGCLWTATSSESWLTLITRSGSGGADISSDIVDRDVKRL